ncbi:MAG: DUF3276 family protein [Saprospiraceae bacterium]|nr:DUF3276 family protein [Saprospiraceae bacterium]
MEHENSQKRFESVYSTKVRAGKRRTYFFDVRRTKGDDYYITLTESTRRFNGDGYERHKIFLYKEDFNRFLQSLEEAVNHVKTELMPDYDYDEFTKRQQEWEARRAAEQENESGDDHAGEEETTDESTTDAKSADDSVTSDESESTETSEGQDEVSDAGDSGGEDDAGGAQDPSEIEEEEDMSW